jgi:hypothetical protein
MSAKQSSSSLLLPHQNNSHDASNAIEWQQKESVLPNKCAELLGATIYTQLLGNFLGLFNRAIPKQTCGMRSGKTKEEGRTGYFSDS